MVEDDKKEARSPTEKAEGIQATYEAYAWGMERADEHLRRTRNFPKHERNTSWLKKQFKGLTPNNILSAVF